MSQDPRALCQFLIQQGWLNARQAQQALSAYQAQKGALPLQNLLLQFKFISPQQFQILQQRLQSQGGVYAQGQSQKATRHRGIKKAIRMIFAITPSCFIQGIQRKVKLNGPLFDLLPLLLQRPESLSKGVIPLG